MPSPVHRYGSECRGEASLRSGSSLPPVGVELDLASDIAGQHSRRAGARAQGSTFRDSFSWFLTVFFLFWAL